MKLDQLIAKMNAHVSQMSPEERAALDQKAFDKMNTPSNRAQLKAIHRSLQHPEVKAAFERGLGGRMAELLKD